MVNIGDRVLAISHTDENKVYIFGRGVYAGREVPDKELGVKVFNVLVDFPNPKINLDNGKVVFGCECWWGPEKDLEAKLKDRELVEVDINESRKGNISEKWGKKY